jgi:hypothetical protein
MTTIYTNHHRFDRVEIAEEVYENLLRGFAPRIFPGYRWYSFKPSIQSPYGVAHPDAAIFRVDGGEWWVVEVELARHSVRYHVEVQLQKLREGWYSRKVLDYIAAREPDAVPLLDLVNARDPRFLLILDDTASAIERVAREMDYEVLHIFPFIAGGQLYATAVEGRNPLKITRPRTGVPLTLTERQEVARFLLMRQDIPLPEPLAAIVRVGTRLVKVWVEEGGTGVVLAISRDELLGILGDRPYYLLHSAAGELSEIAYGPQERSPNA